MKIRKFKTLQEAWEGLNEKLIIDFDEIISEGGTLRGRQMMSFSNYIIIDKAWVDPEFDFGMCFGYTMRKWTSLINNYVSRLELLELKEKKEQYEERQADNYNITLWFKNKHDSGKACLISLTFSKIPKQEKIIAYFHVRAGELTKRVLIDFVLIQRIGEYLYGKKKKIEIHYISPLLFTASESFVMYHNHRDLYKLLRNQNNPYAVRTLKVLDEFLSIDPSTITYRVNLRSVNQLQRGDDGKPISGRKSLFAKNLILL